MAVSIDTEDPADLFLRLYDAMGDGPWDDHSVVKWLRSDAWVDAQSHSLCSEVVQTGRAPRELVDQIAAEGPRGIFAALKGLDDALAHADLRFSTAAETHGMYDLATRNFTLGHLNSDPAEGLLLFRVAAPPRPHGLPARATTFGVIRVPPEVMSVHNVNYGPVGPFDIPFAMPAADAAPQITVGCVAMLESYAEMSMQVRQDYGVRRYRFCPRAASLKDRVRRVLAELDRSGATIGILPEATLSDELLQAWTEAIRESPPDWDSSLHWILVGSGPVGGQDPPRNRAVMLLRDEAHQILCYDKHFDFTLTPNQLRDWKLERELGSEPICEDIQRGHEILVRESRFGRFAILICEDVTHLTEAGAALAHLGVSHVFVPVFSPPITEQTWSSWAGRKVLENTGATILVANSRAVGHAMELEEFGTCSIAIPPAGTHDEWPEDIPVEVGTSRSAEEVTLLATPTAQLKRFTT